MNIASQNRYLAQEAGHEPLIGLAALMRMAFSGFDLTPLGERMLARAARDPDDANALMDLSTILHLRFNPEVALATQAQALEIQQLYHLPSAVERPGIRLLAIMGAGDLMANAPLEFLLEQSDVSLAMLYMAPGLPFPQALPEHDVAFIAVSESDRNLPLLKELDVRIRSWPRPVLNAPERIARTGRTQACALLRDAPGVVVPGATRLDRQTFQRLGDESLSRGAVNAQDRFPLIARPVGSHAGRGLIKIDQPVEIAGYLQNVPAHDYYVTPFIDYRSPDGLFRKYRIVLIDGRAFAVHMAISEQWMVHYLNAGMAENADRRAEEAAFMANFDVDFGRRHAAALQTINERIGLDYLVIDCAETPEGQLLVFEVDSGAVIHAMDPVDVFPYKPPQMQKIFTAFRALLAGAARRRVP